VHCLPAHVNIELLQLLMVDQKISEEESPAHKEKPTKKENYSKRRQGFALIPNFNLKEKLT